MPPRGLLERFQRHSRARKAFFLPLLVGNIYKPVQIGVKRECFSMGSCLLEPDVMPLRHSPAGENLGVERILNQEWIPTYLGMTSGRGNVAVIHCMNIYLQASIPSRISFPVVDEATSPATPQIPQGLVASPTTAKIRAIWRVLSRNSERTVLFLSAIKTVDS
jgi:hypothetical protein